MRLKSLKGKVTQLRQASPKCWAPFINGWLNRRGKASVPCLIPGCPGLLQLPPQDFYDSYEYFCEHPEGRRELAYFMERIKPGDVFYDVGAFRGIFSAAALLKFAQGVVVHTFEPVRKNVEAIEQIRQLNRFSNLTIVGSAVGDGSALPGSEKDDMLRADDAPTSSDATRVNTITLDHYIANGNPPPSLMKIDVEGYELQVMAGARECLKRVKPRLWLEVHPTFLKAQGRSHDEVLDQLRGIGYRIDCFEDHAGPGRETSYHVWCT